MGSSEYASIPLRREKKVITGVGTERGTCMGKGTRRGRAEPYLVLSEGKGLKPRGAAERMEPQEVGGCGRPSTMCQRPRRIEILRTQREGP
jgi:hypothetical protein